MILLTILFFIWAGCITFAVFKQRADYDHYLNMVLNELDMVSYDINLSKINDYFLLNSQEKDLSIEQEFILHSMQNSLNFQAEWIGLDFIPFPRPPEVPEDSID